MWGGSFGCVYHEACLVHQGFLLPLRALLTVHFGSHWSATKVKVEFCRILFKQTGSVVISVCLSLLLPSQGLLWAGSDSFVWTFHVPGFTDSCSGHAGMNLCGCTFLFLGHTSSDGQLGHVYYLLTSVKLLSPSVPCLTSIGVVSLSGSSSVGHLTCPPSVKMFVHWHSLFSWVFLLTVDFWCLHCTGWVLVTAVVWRTQLSPVLCFSELVCLIWRS